jgi:hypothetical protein
MIQILDRFGLKVMKDLLFKTTIKSRKKIKKYLTSLILAQLRNKIMI